jgi:imidazolonepropionase-like amidohydrolase
VTIVDRPVLHEWELLGLADDRGAIEVGKRADLVLLAGAFGDLDKLADRIAGVWKDGVRAT